MQLSSLVAAMEARLPAILADTEELVKCESPSADLEAVARSADIVAVVGARHLGSVAERIVIDGRTHLRWRLGEGPARVLLLCHHDTVHAYPLHAIGQDLYVVREPEAQTWVPITFYALATGERYLHFGARATPKVS